MLVAPPSLPPPGRAVAMPPPLTASIRHEVSASALSVDATGAFAVLAGRRGLHVVDLEAPHAPVVAAFHQPSKWEVAVAKCSPHAQFRGHVASTSNRYTLIWNISYAPAAGDLDAMSDPGAGTSAGTSAGAAYSTTPPASVGRGAHLSPDAHVNSPTTSSNNAVVATLRAHTRTVSDLSWSLSDPMLLATCSADTKTHLWDLRAPQRPAQTLATYTASAVQVEWNRVDPFTLATAHDGEVRVWDTRASRDNKPLVLVTAHMQKIYGLDWHPQRAQELLTCSEDKTVKVWDISQPRACQGSLTTSAPVWRARYSPFGDGIVTISQRLDFSLRLWSISRAATDLSASAAGAMESGIDPSAPSPSVNGAAPSGGNTAAVRIDPVHTFAGHHDLVKGMAWRAYPTSGNGGDTGTGYQLVSWSKDQELRLWRMEPQQLQACGYDGLPGSYSVNPRGADEQRDIKRSGTRADVLHMYSSSKYDVSALKADFVPLVVPKTAVPLGPSEYFLEENNSSLQALLALEEDLIKGESGDSSDSGPESSSEEDRDEYEESGENKYSTDVKVSRRKKRSTSDMSTGDIILGKEKTQAGQANRAAAALPCPRFSGACFSGPNMLVIFDSRVAIGQSRSSVVTSAASAAGKGKAPAPPIKVPRTYDELLDMRDDRFASKKNKKPPVKLLTSAAKSMLGAMDLASEWGQYDMDSSTIGYSDTDGDAATSRLHHQFNGGGGLFFSSSSSLLPSTDGGNDIESTIHGGSEYLKTYFANSEYHLPVNHPDHRISVPTSSIPGAALSPRASTVRSSLTAGSGGGSALTGPKRIDQSTPVPPALNLDLSLSVTILDLSKLCGVSSILTYKTDLAPRYLLKQQDEEEYAVNQQQLDRKKKQRVKNAKKRSFALLSWMLEASKQVTPAYTDGHSNALILSRGGKHRHSTTTTKHMSHILRSLLSKKHNSKTSDDPSNGTPGASGSAVTSAEDDDDDDTVSLTCAENARIAAMAGRSDLQQVWKLLEISTAPAVRLPIFDNPGKDSVHLATDHPWSAHPFGKRLVTRVLNMYEQAGDVHALASIVCALKPHDNSASHIDDIAQSELMSSWLDGEPSGVALLDGPDNGNPLKKSASSMTILQSGTPPDLGELPPVMKSVRRSSSHNDGRPTSDNSSSSFVAATPSGSSSSVTSSPHRPVSPIRDRDGIARDKSEASGWKMDFEKIENPFKTWSGGSIKEAPPRPLSDDMFRSPSAPGKPSATPLISPHLRPILEPNAHAAVADVNAREVVSLSLTQRTLADDRCLLSSDIEDEMRYDAYKQSYAEVLYRYGAMNLRNDVLKTVSRVREEPEGITVGLICGTCGTHTSSPLCSNCHDFAVKCSVCQLVVRGQSMFCMACGHGGHVNHLREWFEFENACPTGCGCWCKQATATMPVLDAEETEMSRDQVAPSRSFSF